MAPRQGRGGAAHAPAEAKGEGRSAVPPLALESFALDDCDSAASSRAPSDRGDGEEDEGVWDVEKIFEFNIDQLVSLARATAWGTSSAPAPAPGGPAGDEDDADVASPASPTAGSVSAEFAQARNEELMREVRLLRKELKSKDWQIERLRRAVCELLCSSGAAKWAHAPSLKDVDVSLLPGWRPKKVPAARKSWAGGGRPGAPAAPSWHPEVRPIGELLVTPEKEKLRVKRSSSAEAKDRGGRSAPAGAAPQASQAQRAAAPVAERADKGAVEAALRTPRGGAGIGTPAIGSKSGVPSAFARLEMRKWLAAQGGGGSGPIGSRPLTARGRGERAAGDPPAPASASSASPEAAHKAQASNALDTVGEEVAEAPAAKGQGRSRRGSGRGGERQRRANSAGPEQRDNRKLQWVPRVPAAGPIGSPQKQGDAPEKTGRSGGGRAKASSGRGEPTAEDRRSGA